MAFLILGENMLGHRGKREYRGTYRESIPHADNLPDDAEYNRLFHWYVGQEASGLVTDLGRAQRLTKLLRDELGQQHFELIEAVRAGEAPRASGEFLGHDLSHAFYYSLLSWGLDFSFVEDYSELGSPIRELLALVQSHFRPHLNERCLLTDRRTAEFCLRVMMALQALSPGLWERDESGTFDVVAIYRLL